MTTNIQSFAGDVQIDSGNLSVKSLEVKDGVTKLGSNNTAYSNVGVMMTRKDGASNVAFLFTEDGANVVLGYTNDDALEGDRIDILTDEKANLVVYGNVYVTGSVHGDGSTLTGLVTTLQSVTEFGADTDQTILFTNEITGINVSSNVLVSGNVTANVYYGDGGLLANITQTLEGITAIGNTTPYTLEFNNTDTSFVTVSNVGIGNALPTADLCVGSNVVIDDERLNKINVVGNVACHQLNLGSVEILPAYSLENVTQISNTTTNTMSFNNSTLAFDTQKMAGIGIIPSSADVGVSGLHVDGHLRLGGEAENTDEEQMYIKAAGALGVLANESDTNNTNTELRLQSGDTNNSNITMVGKSSAQYMTFGTNAEERMRIDSSGRVGVGTVNPTAHLELHSSTLDKTHIRVYADGPAVTKDRIFELTDVNGSGLLQMGDRFNNDSTTYKIQLNTEGNSFFNGGNVGIGTVSSGVPLSVHGSDPEDTFDAQVRIASTSTTGAENSGGVLIFQGHDGVTPRGFASVGGLKENGASGNYASYLRFSTRASSGGSISERMRITSTGDVGIGTTSPDGRLHISSGTSGDCHLILQSDTDNNNESDNPKIVFRQDGAINTAEIGLGNNMLALRGTSGIAFYDGTASSTNIDNIENTSTELMRITDGGNVGIGTTSPEYTLDVVGKSSLGTVVLNPQTYLMSNVNYFEYTSSTITTFNKVLLQIDKSGTANSDHAEYSGYVDCEIVAQRTITNGGPEIFTSRVNFMVAYDDAYNRWQFNTFIQENKSFYRYISFTSTPVFKYKYDGRQLQLYVSFDAKEIRSYTSFTARITSDGDHINDISLPGPDELMGTGTDGTAELGICYGLGNTNKASYVGIGTDDPTSNLHVAGNAYVSSNLTVGTANLHVDTTTGFVGVGTTNPQGILHVNGGTGDAKVIIEADTNNSGESDNPKIVFRQDGGYYTGEVGLANNQMVFRSKSTVNGNTGFIFYSNVGATSTTNVDDVEDTQIEVMRIQGNGYVGIGTANPTSNLHVAGDAYVSSNLTTTGFVGVGTANPQGILHILDQNMANATELLRLEKGGGTGDIDDTSFGHIGMYLVDANTGGGEVARISYGHNGGGGTENEGKGQLGFWTSNTGGAEGVPEERMTIRADGNVGIGTDTPQAKLDTRGDAVFDTGKDDTTLTGLLNYTSTQSAIDAGVAQPASTGSISASTDINPPPGVAGDVIAKFVNSHTNEIFTYQFTAPPLSITTGDVIYFGAWIYATLNVGVQFFKFGETTQSSEFTAIGNSTWTWYEKTITSTSTTSSPEFRIDNNTPGRTYYFTGFTIRKNPSQTTGLPFTPRYSPASGRGPVLSTQTLVAREAAIQTLTGNVGIGTASPAYTLDVAGKSSLGTVVLNPQTYLMSNVHYIEYSSSTNTTFNQVLLQFDKTGTGATDQAEYAGYVDCEIVAQRTVSNYVGPEIFTARVNFIAGYNDQDDVWKFTTFVQENKSVSGGVPSTFSILQSIPVFKYKYNGTQLQLYVSFNAKQIRAATSFTARITGDGGHINDVSLPDPDALMGTGTDGTAELGICYGVGGNASNVGIGTDDPTSNLHVVGDAYVSSNLTVGTANLHVDTTTGFVGIGTTEPGGPLDVVASSEGNYIARFKNESTASDEDARIVIEASDGGGESQILLQTTNETTTHKWNISSGSGITPMLEFQYNSDFNGGTRAMVIKHGGNVVVGGATNDYAPFTAYGGSLHDGDGIFSSKTCASLDVDRGGGSVPEDVGTGAILEFRHHSDYRYVTIESVSEGNNSADIGLRFKTVDTSAGPQERMRIDAHGLVGIGTTIPQAGLHVHKSSAPGFSTAAVSYFDYNDTQLFHSASASYPDNISIFGQADIATNGEIVSVAGTIGGSDRRIKKNIVDVVDETALETLRLLKPKRYEYKDKIKRGQEVVWGFIAQEVREVLPYSTKEKRQVLPNIYELANVSQSNVITFTNFNTSNLESNATTLIRIKGIDGEDHDVHLAEVIDEHTIRVEEDLSAWTGSVDETGNVITEITTTTLTLEEYEALEDKSGYVANITGYQNANVVVSIEEYNALEDTTGYEEVVQDYTKTTTTYPGTQLFVYGQEVDDFVYLKKEAIWTVATAALQEVDRQLQAEKAKVATLETQLASVLARLDALESA
jgi:hypothetical protein